MQHVREMIDQAAATSATVLVSGETGTGKELVAEALHANSARADQPLVKLTCAALAESILESELFGHEQGAFTGALRLREGRFMQADRGTLFLDEVSEISLPIQVKLLRFLQERRFERVGGNETLKVDVRLIAATNRDLASLVKEGSFREDLYYRLNIVHVKMPPLRAHVSDIPALAQGILVRMVRQHGRPIAGFERAALEVLMAHGWGGNVRELENVIERVVVLSDEKFIRPERVRLALDSESEPQSIDLGIPGSAISEIERAAILRTLESVDGSTSKAAAILGISARKIQYRLREYRAAGFIAE